MIGHYGPITQIAWVTEDIGATEGLLSDQFGAGEWTRLRDIDFDAASCRYRGLPADFTAHIALTYIGDMQLELIQPVRGQSIYSEFLDNSGPGLHHVCFEPPDFDAAVESARESGLEVPQYGTIGESMRFAYVAAAPAGIPYMELADVGPDMRGFFDHVRKNALGR